MQSSEPERPVSFAPGAGDTATLRLAADDYELRTAEGRLGARIVAPDPVLPEAIETADGVWDLRWKRAGYVVAEARYSGLPSAAYRTSGFPGGHVTIEPDRRYRLSPPFFGDWWTLRTGRVRVGGALLQIRPPPIRFLTTIPVLDRPAFLTALACIGERIERSLPGGGGGGAGP